MKKDNKEKITILLRKNSQGLTIQDLVNKIGLSWNTITKILAMLEGEDKIVIREVGRAKLHYFKKDERREFK